MEGSLPGTENGRFEAGFLRGLWKRSLRIEKIDVSKKCVQTCNGGAACRLKSTIWLLMEAPFCGLETYILRKASG
jgi:hypothetical protein